MQQWAHRGYQVHQWHWGENATRQKSQTGVMITCGGHWKAHKLQDDDGQTQTSVSWAGRPPPSPRPPPPGRLEMITVDAAAAACACRSAALHLSASCHFRIYDSAPSSTRQNICRPSVHYFATLRTSFQRPTYPPSGAPPSPSLAPLSSPYLQQAPKTPSSVVDASSPCVLPIPQTIFSVCALSPLCSRKLSWQARRRTIGCGRHASVSAIRRIGGAWSGETIVGCQSQGCSGSTACNLRVESRSPRLSATAPSTVSAHPGGHRFPSCTAGNTQAL